MQMNLLCITIIESNHESRSSTDRPPSFHATFNAKNLMYYPKSEIEQDPPELKLKREASRDSQTTKTWFQRLTKWISSI
jgi:hypothetical protein